MSGKQLLFKGLLALMIVAVLAVGGIAIYRAGFTHGMMTNITLPEGSEFPVESFERMPYGHTPLGWHAGPRIGLLGIFPLLCFGGFFFLLLMFGFGFMTSKRAWMHYGPGSHPNHWRHHGPPPWGSGKPPWEQEQAESETPPAETDQTER